MTLKALMAASLILAAPSARADDWTKTDTAFELAYTALHLVDMFQTHAIVNPHSNGIVYHEVNPILGPRPTHTEISLYFAGTLALHWGVARLLPNPWRRVFQIATSGMELTVVAHNIQAKVGISVQW